MAVVLFHSCRVVLGQAANLKSNAAVAEARVPFVLFRSLNPNWTQPWQWPRPRASSRALFRSARSTASRPRFGIETGVEHRHGFVMSFRLIRSLPLLRTCVPPQYPPRFLLHSPFHQTNLTKSAPTAVPKPKAKAATTTVASKKKKVLQEHDTNGASSADEAERMEVSHGWDRFGRGEGATGSVEADEKQPPLFSVSVADE